MEKKSYTAQKRKYSENVWENIEPLKVDIFKWEKGYTPRTEAKVFYDESGFYVQFTVWTDFVTIRYKNMHDPVYFDSCVEIFFAPSKKKEFINFEINAIGAMLTYIGEERGVRRPILAEREIFEAKSSIKDPENFNDDKWTLEFKIPFSLLHELYGEFDLKDGFDANFYKCGDEPLYKHFGMWSEIIAPVEDFYLREFFGKLYFEE